MLLNRLQCELDARRADEEAERFRLEVVLRLLDMRKAGRFYELCVDGWEISVRFNAWEDRMRISFAEACWLAGIKKGPGQSVMITGEVKSA